jgi:hypothetical protein
MKIKHPSHGQDIADREAVDAGHLVFVVNYYPPNPRLITFRAKVEPRMGFWIEAGLDSGHDRTGE